jgi:hypothetical protein
VREARERNQAARAGLLDSMRSAASCKVRICWTSSITVFGLSKAFRSSRASAADAASKRVLAQLARLEPKVR